MEVLQKAIPGIINRRLLSSVQFHDILYLFRAGRGTGTATLEANILQQLIYMRETVLHYIFLDLLKAYDALDRERRLDILAEYGVGPRTIRILRTYWSRLHMVGKSGGRYGPAFHRHRGVTQGDPLSPTIFNMVVDAIIQHWVMVVWGPPGRRRTGGPGKFNSSPLGALLCQ